MDSDDRNDDRNDRDAPPVAGLTQLRNVDPPAALVAGVMRRIGEPPPRGLWHWLRRSFTLQIRLTPLGAGGFALGLAVVVVLALRAPPSRHPDRAPPAAPVLVTSEPARTAPQGSGSIRVRFRLQAKGAKRVSLVGSFNQWSTDGTVLQPVSDGGSFVGTVELAPGTYQYMFVVDGKWVTDPAADERRDDGFGRQNALLRL